MKDQGRLRKIVLIHFTKKKNEERKACWLDFMNKGLLFFSLKTFIILDISIQHLKHFLCCQLFFLRIKTYPVLAILHYLFMNTELQ